MLTNRPIQSPIVYRGPAAAIDIRERQQFGFWCRIFGISHHELASLVSTVGGDPEVVLRHLKRAV
jgi:hypothetical protein